MSALFAVLLSLVVVLLLERTHRRTGGQAFWAECDRDRERSAADLAARRDDPPTAGATPARVGPVRIGASAGPTSTRPRAAA